MTVSEQVVRVITYLADRKKAYQLTFQLNQPANVLVLEDLARFCRAKESCAVPGDRDKTFILEGRREVFLRIQNHLNLSPEQLFTLYNANYQQTKE